MSRTAASAVERWEQLFDRDIETLIAGGTPANTDLQPLRSFVASLGSMARAEVSDEFIVFHAAESAATAAAVRSAHVKTSRPTGVKTRLGGLRRRVATVATSLALVLGMTGISWAADGAVPGDWYYGIDRALEAIGIGNGGSSERAQEQQLSSQSDSMNEPADVGIGLRPPDTTGELTGLDRAAAQVAGAPSGGGVSAYARAQVVERLKNLNDLKTVRGSVASGAAKDRTGPPEQAGAPDEKGPPEGVGNPAEKPSDSGAGRNGQAQNENSHRPARP